MPKKDNKTTADDINRSNDKWVVLLPEKELDDKDEEKGPSFCKLRHPKTNLGNIFLLSADNQKTHEVLQFQEKFRSWFVEETVLSDGTLHVTTPVDPVFLMLPYLMKAAKNGKFMPLEQIIEDEEFPESHRLCNCQGVQWLHQVADVKGSDDLHVYRYSEEKTLSWLTSKVKRLGRVLQEHQINTSSTGSHVVTYLRSIKSTGSSDDEALSYAFGMISDYISPDLSTVLKESLGIKEAIVHDKPDIDTPKAKRAKKDGGPLEDYTNGMEKNLNSDKKNTRQTIAQKQLEKVDRSGMKNISSFFKAKPKK